jgi:protease-4
LSKNRNTVIIVVVALVAVLLLTGALILGFGFMALMGTDLVEEGDRVAVVYLYGAIGETVSGFYGTGITPAHVAGQLKRAAADPGIKGVVLRINSPGGSIAASQEIAAMIRDFAKPVVVSMGDMAASGGYYISAPAKGIVAQPGTLTGSIGVITQVMNMEGLYDKIGIEVETIRSGRHKDMLGRTMTPEERDLIQRISDEAHEQFITDIAEDRGLDLEKVRELATGELFLGSQAAELGLVDRLGGIEEAILYLAEIAGIEDPVRYEFPQPTLFTQLFGFGLSIPEIIRKMLLPPEILILDRLREGYPPEILYQVK